MSLHALESINLPSTGTTIQLYFVPVSGPDSIIVESGQTHKKKLWSPCGGKGYWLSESAYSSELKAQISVPLQRQSEWSRDRYSAL